MYLKNIENKSQWKTKPLQEIINRCEEFRGVNLDKRLQKVVKRGYLCGTTTWSPLRIATAKTQTNGKYTGRCYPYKRNIYLGLPKAKKFEEWSSEETRQRKFDKEQFAQVVLHEIDHLLGLKHKDMLWSHELDTPDLEDVEVEPKDEFAADL